MLRQAGGGELEGARDVTGEDQSLDEQRQLPADLPPPVSASPADPDTDLPGSAERENSSGAATPEPGAAAPRNLFDEVEQGLPRFP